MKGPINILDLINILLDPSGRRDPMNTGECQSSFNRENGNGCRFVLSSMFDWVLNTTLPSHPESHSMKQSIGLNSCFHGIGNTAQESICANKTLFDEKS